MTLHVLSFRIQRIAQRKNCQLNVGDRYYSGKSDVKNNMTEEWPAEKEESERRMFKKKSSLTIFGRRARYVHWLRSALFHVCVRVCLKLCHCFDSYAYVCTMCVRCVCAFTVYSCHIDCLQASPDPSTEMFKLVNTHTWRVCFF